ncbi:MAG: UbiD family decarboxylase, partial [Euryarchaeota archaeon]|nr:UbiD family decarboxylase [Euryarchaeota archaeon]
MSLRGFLDKLKEEGKLREVNESLSPVYEVSASVGKEPTLFTNVNGSRVVMNVLGSRQLLADALGVSPDEIIQT